MAYVEDSGEGRWTVAEAIALDVPAPVITLSLLERLRSRESNSFTDRLLSAMRNEFGGHAIRSRKPCWGRTPFRRKGSDPERIPIISTPSTHGGSVCGPTVGTHQLAAETVEGGVGPGCLRHGWRGQASRDGLRRPNPTR